MKSVSYSQAQTTFKQTGHHLGNKVIFGYTNEQGQPQLVGYAITEYQQYEPKTLQFVSQISGNGINSLDQAYDALFQEAITAPDFSKVFAK